MPAQPVTLVVVDDDANFRRAARELFTMRGYSVLCEAGCTASALSAVRRLLPDVVVVDIHLGEESGFDLARELTREHPGLAVVLMSAASPNGGAEHVRASGARGFLPKSRITVTDLSEIL
jgi:DNA-binding NarL/FixJ family response regulator